MNWKYQQIIQYKTTCTETNNFNLEAPANLAENAALMTLTGAVIGGVASLISTAVSADLGRHPELANSKEALSTVTGIIDGTGSFGAAFGQVIW